jgi:hypothetical protein
VKVQRSSVHGWGLFAGTTLLPGTIVADYTECKRVTEDHYNCVKRHSRATGSPMHIAKIRGKFYDGTNYVAGAINRADASHPQNVKMNGWGKMKIVGTQPIASGSELFMKYGKGFVISK